MIVAGVDIGASSAKAAVVVDDRLVGFAVLPTGMGGERVSREVINAALDDAGVGWQEVECVVATGYGRFNVPFAHSRVTEISCHARGGAWWAPEVRTILDMGGQDCKAIRCDGRGNALNFMINDKCAAGTGKYLERVANLMGVSLDELGKRSLEPIQEVITISSFCAIFAESEFRFMLRQGKGAADLLAAAHAAVVDRIGALLEKLGGVEPQFLVTGGIAKNIGIVRRMEERFGIRNITVPEPLIVGAVGAALFATDVVRRGGAACRRKKST